MKNFKSLILFKPSRAAFAGLSGPRFFAVASILLGLTLAGAALVSSKGRSGYFYQVQSIGAESLGITDPVGLAFSPSAGLFYVFEGAPAEGGPGSRSEIVKINPFGDRVGSDRPAESISDPLNVAFAGSTNNLYFLDRSKRAILELQASQSGKLAETQGMPLGPGAWPDGLLDPQGMAYDAGRERLYFLDAAGPAIMGIAIGSPGSEPTRISIDSLANVALRGVAYNPADEHFYVLAAEEHVLYELDESGRVLSFRDLSEIGLRKPQSMVFAPSADPTDGAGIMDLFIADSGGQGSAASPGQIVELSFRGPVASPAVPQLPISVVQIIDTSKTSWDPSSPDPAGVAYRPATGRLLISDSEVEENHPDFKGKNVFESTLTGDLKATCDTLAFSVEPTGVAVNPTNGHIFFSDDDKNRIFEVDLVDGIYCNADDIVTHMSVGALGSDDAESVAYAQNRLYVADGIAAEIFIIDLGPDGVLGGGNETLVDQFDTTALGLRDPQGIEYNPERNTLLIVSTTGDDYRLVETTKAGKAVYTYDLYFLGNMRRSGLALAPNSKNPAVNSVYMASRGLDNDENPTENDGLVYELLLGKQNTEPTPTPGPASQSIYLPVIRGK